jgi:hypothetical protein
MRNVIKENMEPNQQALHDPWKDTTDDLEELDPDYDDGFAQLLQNVGVTLLPLQMCHAARSLSALFRSLPLCKVLSFISMAMLLTCSCQMADGDNPIEQQPSTYFAAGNKWRHYV